MSKNINDPSSNWQEKKDVLAMTPLQYLHRLLGNRLTTDA
jgi:hypothetical protein